MLSIPAFQPQVAIPPLTSLFNIVRCTSHSAAASGKRQQASATITTKTEEPLSSTVIGDTLKSTLNEIGLEGLSKGITIEELNPLLDSRRLPKDSNPPFLSCATFFENKNGFAKEDLRTRKNGRSHLQTFKINFPLLTNTLKVNGIGSGLYHQPARMFKTERYDKSKGFGKPASADNESIVKTIVDTVMDLDARKVKHTKEMTNLLEKEDDLDRKRQLSKVFYYGYSAKGAGNTGKTTPPFGVLLTRMVQLSVLAIVGYLFITFYKITDTGRIAGLGRGEQFEINAEDIDVNFTDVVGMQEAKQELTDVVEYLRYPEKFKKMGAKLPSGVLLVGPPGMGKTLLARAVAGEAGVPFFHASGSEFDEIFVGTGAKRVRSLFDAAKLRAPCVIFIDEIDTVGAKRTNSQIHPYANQTINMLLSEMDGFKQNEGIIVLGATNRRDTLDKALLRPGRFDVEVRVFPPDVAARKGILDHYLKDVVVGDDIDTEQVAKGTSGCTGADLKNIVNQAALRAAMDGSPSVLMEHMEYAKDKILMGPAMQSRVMTEEALKGTAYHEAGHALVSWYTKGANEVYKVTIVPRGMSLGHTSFTAPKDPYTTTKSQLMAHMDVAMGGRLGEEVFYGSDDVSSGASQDFTQATSIATAMVKYYGMSSKVGVRSFDTGSRDDFGVKAESEISPATAELIDEEIKRLLQESYERSKTILQKHRSELVALAEALLKYETLDKEDMRLITSGKKLTKTLPTPAPKQKTTTGTKTDGRKGPQPEKAPLLS